MSKENFKATCPYCGKRMFHHAVHSDDDNIFTVTCWEDDGGCGKEYQLKGEFCHTIYYLDKYGMKTKDKEELL